MNRQFSTFITGLALMCAAPLPAIADEPGFREWLKEFRSDARAAGISDAVYTAAFANVVVNERVIQLNDDQPEFSRAVWDYLASAVSADRIEKGRLNLATHRELLTSIEVQYGVDAEVLVAIWGLESSYGSIMGSHDVLGALATLGWRGRRTAYGREQLIAALRIVQNGYAERSQLRGSWAGAMGHTQFIPTTYLAYAVDANGDGRRDVWGELSDVFASTANYLRASKYVKDSGWGVEVRLPLDFDYELSDADVSRAVAEWSAAGVTTTRGDLVDAFDPNKRGRIILPAGAKGPAFLTFENFDAILKYNRSTSYALAVAMLSDRIAGRSADLVVDWPRSDRPLSLTERRLLQEKLADNGFQPGPVDGVIGAGTRRALRAWQRSVGLPADGYASADMLMRLTDARPIESERGPDASN